MYETFIKHIVGTKKDECSICVIARSGRCSGQSDAHTPLRDSGSGQRALQTLNAS
jgi:hypothetical protein